MPEYKTKNKESDLRLSIHLHVNGFSFFTHNQKTNKASKIYREVFDSYVPVENLHEHIRAALKTQGVLEQSYNEVRCSVENNLATLVPKSLFEEAALHEYVEKDIDVKPNDFITYDVQPSTDWICVYAPFVNVNNMLLDAFGAFRYFHAVSVWLTPCPVTGLLMAPWFGVYTKNKSTCTSHCFETKNCNSTIALKLQKKKT